MGSKRQFLRLERMSQQGMGKWEDRFTDKAKELLKLGATDEVLAIAFDVSIGTIAAWKRNHPEFLEAINSTKIKTDALIAMAWVRMCTGYDFEEKRIVYDKYGEIEKQEVVVKHQAPNPWAAVKWLQLRQREIWGEDKNGGGSGTTININNLNQINMDALNDEELRLALKLGVTKRIGTGE